MDSLSDQTDVKLDQIVGSFGKDPYSTYSIAVSFTIPAGLKKLVKVEGAVVKIAALDSLAGTSLASCSLVVTDGDLKEMVNFQLELPVPPKEEPKILDPPAEPEPKPEDKEEPVPDAEDATPTEEEPVDDTSAPDETAETTEDDAPIESAVDETP